ncbi:hypothetical protein ZOSMA_63G00630 [Zostera marina]|uniref:Uncharacterized protein n=1 Tax=Zostera marina TaxID=29655 RepID=A0A0K9NVD5_ZOSMR|nr:hypothetical protein ZOSMA_63G00630 [Zostera marina]
MEKEKKKGKLHFIIIPYLAPGHILPSIDFGRLLASRGNVVTIITTTPAYVARFTHFKTTTANQPPIRFAGVPPRQEGGCESAYEVKDPLCVFEISKGVKDLVKEWIEKEKMGVYGDIPICMVSDYCQTWTRNVASEFGLVRFVFNCIGSLPSLCEAILQKSYGEIAEEEIIDNREKVIKGIPEYGSDKRKSFRFLSQGYINV